MTKLTIYLSVLLLSSFLIESQADDKNNDCMCIEWDSDGECKICTFDKLLVGQNPGAMMPKGCICLEWNGSTCTKWSGGTACSKLKRSVAEGSHETTKKGCHCISHTPSGLCFEWAGGENCDLNEKKIFVDAGNGKKCLCINWDLNGACTLCSFDKKQ